MSLPTLFILYLCLSFCSWLDRCRPSDLEYRCLLTHRTDYSKSKTWRYEPPESPQENSAWSQRYDIWSIGCILLEFIVWLLHGPKGLDDFNKKIVNAFGKECQYFEMERKNGKTSFKVHPAVIDAMESLSQHRECESGKTALGDLLGVVRERLLVISLASSTFGEGNALDDCTGTQKQTRADASILKMALANIINRGNMEQAYWLKSETSGDVPSVHMTTTTTTVASTVNDRSFGAAEEQVTSNSSSALVSTDRLRDDKKWKYSVDNTFASKVVNNIGTSLLHPEDTGSSKLCAKCQQLEFWAPHFSIVDNWIELEANLRDCDFCRWRWELCRHLNREAVPVVRFDRDQSMLRLNEEYPPVLSLRRSPGKLIRHPQMLYIRLLILKELSRRHTSRCNGTYPDRISTALPNCEPRLLQNSPRVAERLR